MSMARDYDNRARTAAARETRRRILAVARTSLVDDGYPALRISTLAAAAGVSPQTVYNAIGGKAEVLKAVYDVAVVGDDEPVPMSERPEFIRLAEATSPADWSSAYAHYTAELYRRIGDVVGAVLRPGEALDGGAGQFAETIDRERRIGTTHAVTALGARLGWPDSAVAPTIDAVWVLNAPEVYDRLVRRSGWSVERYERWLARQLAACLPPTPGASGDRG
ncbi:TetR/AcrR family transcriptional regulator [Gordonia aichiensis]|uniref:TetR/AcrR family transcriptional regulator n=1 Tax=Gordonia aichiensis TaxID=36820 RepID=UPI003264D9AF